MAHYVTRFLVLCMCMVVGPAAAQVPSQIQSEEERITVTSWIPDGETLASILLVPGWGGGPDDVLGLARFLSANRVEAFVLTPRGWHDSEGDASFHNVLGDIEAALGWVRQHTTHEVVLGGHSFGGGMALAYAAQDSSVSRIISVAGTDHGQLIRQYLSDSTFSSMLNRILASTASPNGPIKFDVDSTLRDLIDGQSTFGLRENASELADRSILMFGGWKDVNTTVDDYLLPQYRAWEASGAEDVTFLVYHTDHGFGNVRAELHRQILKWLTP